MKKLLAVILAVLTVLSLGVPALAADAAPAESPTAYTIIVNGKTLDLSGLPVAPYEEDGVVMVPLRKVGEALGYRVGWDAETGAITIDDDYIQGATLFDGSAKAVFTGHLKVINMSREIENALPTVVHTGGYTFVPADFFREFFNDVTVENGVITIAPSMCELE